MKHAILLLALACGGAHGEDLFPDRCPRTAYELEGHYRCTSSGELQTLSCGEWLTLRTCAAPDLCSPGPVVGCRADPGWCCDGVCGLTAEEADEFTECTCEAPVRRSDGPGKGECLTEPAQ